MNILALSFLYPNTLYPHYGIFVHNRLKAVSKYHEVKVINPIPYFPGCGRLARYKNYGEIPLQETIDGIEVYHPRFFIIPRLFKFIDALTCKAAVMPLVEKLYESYPFDLVDLHWTYPDLPTGIAIKKKYNKKMLVTLRGKEAFHINEGVGREFLIKNYLLKADTVISLSQELQEIAVNMGVKKKHCHVVRNGVDTSAFYYMERDECRKHLNIPLDEKIILSVGSLTFPKGFDRIIKSLSKLLEIDAACKLYIIGSEGPAGDYRRGINQLIVDFDLRGKVSLQGLVDNKDLIYWYNAADLFCLASRGEGSPNVLGEALACGCPSVATDVGAVVEILSNKLNGIVVSNSADGVSSGLKKALPLDWDRKAISSSMHDVDWDWCGREVIAIYDKVKKELS